MEDSSMKARGHKESRDRITVIFMTDYKEINKQLFLWAKHFLFHSFSISLGEWNRKSINNLQFTHPRAEIGLK